MKMQCVSGPGTGNGGVGGVNEPEDETTRWMSVVSKCLTYRLGPGQV